jgi:hypothetical protein
VPLHAAGDVTGACIIASQIVLAGADRSAQRHFGTRGASTRSGSSLIDGQRGILGELDRNRPSTPGTTRTTDYRLTRDAQIAVAAPTELFDENAMLLTRDVTAECIVHKVASLPQAAVRRPGR